MKTAVAILYLGVAAAAAAPLAKAQDFIGNPEQTAQVFHAAADIDGNPYDSCKKDAFDYGVMGHYRRLYILACLDTDMTSTIDTSN